MVLSNRALATSYTVNSNPVLFAAVWPQFSVECFKL